MNDRLVRGLRALVAGLHEHRWLWVLMIAALVVRLHWNLVVHPLEDFIYSDMRGYMRRANLMFTRPEWAPREYDGFYPFGTHVLIYAVQRVFGHGLEDYRTLAIAYAVLGSLLVGFGYLLARRVSHHWFVPPLVGLVLVAYYPFISLGGYVLSEVPFALCMVASTFYLVRMAQQGRRRDAWAAGIIAALGFTVRPQILASIGLFGLYWLVCRRRLPRLRLGLMLQALAPLLLMIAFSSWRLHYHTGRYGLISENGKFNQVFGRCHNNKIFALPDTPLRRKTSFGPPPLIQLAKREAKMPGAWPGLDPAREIEITYTGYIGDSEILGELMHDCIRRTGWLKQIEYSVVNVMLLWRYNVMWPDSGKRFWRPYSQDWGIIHTTTFAVPALVAATFVSFGRALVGALWAWLVRPLLYLLVLVFVPRRHRDRTWAWITGGVTRGLGVLAQAQRARADGMAIVALHLWAIVIIAALILGGVRFRAPYDVFIIILAFEAYAIALVALVMIPLRFLRQRLTRSVEEPDPPSSAAR